MDWLYASVIHLLRVGFIKLKILNMYWLSFDIWNNSHGMLFTKQRIYIKGYKWTPFVKVSIRYKNQGWNMVWINILYGLGLKRGDG